MSFHVTLFGPSCCQIQYGSCSEEESNFGKIQNKKRMRKNPRGDQTESSLRDPSCFEANVSPATLRYDRLVRKLQQSATKMAEPVTRMLKSSLIPDCVSKSPSAEIAQPATKDETFLKRDWSLLPEELLHIISKNLEDEEYCFDVIHARSVCASWRSIFPFPCCLLRPSYSLPSFHKFPRKPKDLCILEKIPLFLFRVRAPAASASYHEYFLGDLGRDNSEDRMELTSTLQCSVKVKIPGSEPTLMNMLDCQIFPLGPQYRMVGWDPEDMSTYYRGVAVLPVNKEGGGEDFIVLLNYSRDLLVLRSAEMRWMRLKKISIADCNALITFKGRFYAVFHHKGIVVINPYSLEVTPLNPAQPLSSESYLVPCGTDELFLVEVIISDYGVLSFSQLACRVSRLDVEAGEWVVVSNLGDRVFFIGEQGNVSCSSKELPDGCGLSGNSILFTNVLDFENFVYKYGVRTGNAEDDLSFLRFSRENPVDILNKSPPVVAIRIEK